MVVLVIISLKLFYYSPIFEKDHLFITHINSIHPHGQKVHVDRWKSYMALMEFTWMDEIGMGDGLVIFLENE